MDSPLLALPHTYRAFYGTFPALRPLQRATVGPLLAGRDLVLQAATASGKTEAVLAPCLERMIREERRWSAIYVVPTRALARDLARRLEGAVRERLGLTLAVRTGDRVRRGGELPDLILTTPESLDVALGSQNPARRASLARTGVVILDEAHASAGQPRGAQLRALLERLERRVGRPLQRIALSATLADPAALVAAFDLRSDAEILVFPGGPPILPQLVHLQGEEDLLGLVEDLADRYGQRKLLLFCDSRGRCERLFATLNAKGRFQGRCALHYSNLSADERARVESRLREQREVLCIATSTLELGIDIGDVDATLLYGPPPSSAAFLQRIGRAGRREGLSRVWGICHGEQAGEQLLRFLGLLRLARRGESEAIRPRVFPSVWVQQVLSCVHERQRLSLSSLQDLFPRDADLLARILPTLERRGWLKREPTGLLAGGRRFFEARIERRLWSNFPWEEPPFSLVVDDRILAEIPAKVAVQLDVGQRVQLSGRRLRILDIDPGERRRIDAVPTPEPEGEELSWVGMSAAVSREAAEAVREVLADEEEPDGLWSRTAHLLAEERRRPVARLANGIEVYREGAGTWRYRTFLGTFGNLVLQEAIRERYPEEAGELASDPLGVTSARAIDFRALALPVDRAALNGWSARHRRLLQATLPLGAFCTALSEALLVEELVTWLDDPRLLATFSRYLSLSSAVVDGDPAALEPPPPIPSRPRTLPVFPATGPPPLPEARRGRAESSLPTFAERRRVTASRLATWIRRDQCERFLGWSSRAASLPLRSAHPERRAARRMHVADVRAELARVHTLEIIARHRPDGALRPLRERQEESLQRIEALARAARATPGERFWLADAVLLGEETLPGGLMAQPDLLAISWDRDQLRIDPGNIGSSPDGHYDQKWQVALCAALLAERGLLTGASTGFLRPKPAPGTDEDPWRSFSLAPWLENVPKLFARARSILEADPEELPWRLGSWCISCPFASACTGEALATREVQLLPDLGRGTHEALRRSGLASLAELAELPEGPAWGTVPGQARALVAHQVTVVPPALPALPQGPVFGVEIEEDEATGQPSAVGLTDLEQGSGRVWAAADLPAARSALLAALEQRFAAAPGSWVAVYGARQHRLLDELAARGDAVRWRALMRDPHTGERRLLDLRRLLLDHVRLPAPGAASLHTVGQVLGLSPALRKPESLLHATATPPDPPLERLRVMAALWGWLRANLPTAAATPGGGVEPGESLRASMLRFLAREHALRRTDILTLQALPLVERIARFRALGPLIWEGSALDVEGNLVHHLRSEEPIGATRLREGDFLRLAPLGLVELQAGLPVILDAIDPLTGRMHLRLRGAARSPPPGQRYSLEEELTDWSHPVLVEVVHEVLGEPFHPVAQMLGQPSARRPPEEQLWAERWLSGPGAMLEPRQAEALLLAFQRDVALIEGPPGTGKTWLLARILLALLQWAREAGRPLRIAVTALTHQAIDQVLARMAVLLPDLPGPPVRIAKLGRQAGDSPIEPLRYAAELRETPWIVVGATGQGLRRLLGRERQRQVFDLVACDEASQLLLPQAWLALVHGSGRALFVGDTHQLPPVLRGDYEEDPRTQTRSVLEHLLERQPRVRLELSHRLNDGLCTFPSRTWYEGTLRPAPAVAGARLVPTRLPRGDVLDAICAPDPPTTLVLLEHRGRREQSPEEADLLARVVERLLERYDLGTEQIAVLSPHRSQNSLVREALAARLGSASLPVVDTIERSQGAEWDVVLFGLTASDSDRVESVFLTDPRRFNVAITRARLKLVVVASEAMFSVLPHSEEAMVARRHLLAFERYCAGCGGLFRLAEDALEPLR